METAKVETVEFDGLPAGVTIQIGNYLVIGTATEKKEEKESA